MPASSSKMLLKVRPCSDTNRSGVALGGVELGYAHYFDAETLEFLLVELL